MLMTWAGRIWGAGKGTAYEGGVRTPLIIRYPQNQEASQVSEAPVITMDRYATALDAAGLKGDKLSVDGRSLWKFRQASNPIPAGRTRFWHYPHHHTEGATPYSAIRKGDYRLIAFLEDGNLELYDLRKDIGETQDLSEALPKVTNRRHRHIKRWRKKAGAQLPRPNPQAE